MAIAPRRVLDPGAPPKPPPPWKRLTPVSGAVLGGSVLIFAAEELGHLPLVDALALYGPAVTRGDQWYRVLTSTVVHGDLINLGANLLVIWFLGTHLERVIGWWRFLLLSLICALGAAVFVLGFSYPEWTAGASGMILGWAGALLPLLPRAGRRQLGAVLVVVALISVLPPLSPDLPFSWQGHLGGFLFGLPCGFLLRNQARHFGLGAPVLLFFAAICVVLAAHAGARAAGG